MPTKKAVKALEQSVKNLRAGAVVEIAIAQLQRDTDQPRRVYEKEPLQELAASIKARGVIEPLVVRVVDGLVIITAGERRWRAAKLAGLETVPCILRERDGEGAIDVMFDQLAENDLREGLNPIERAQALQRLAKGGIGPTEIADCLAKHGIKMSRPAVSNSLRLLNLPANAQELVSSGALNESDARSLLPFIGPEITPKIVATTVKKLGKKASITKREFARALNDSLYSHATLIYGHDNPQNCGKKCACFVTVDSPYGNGKSNYCLNKKALNEKKAAAEERRKKREAKKAATKAAEAAPETDPTKVAPVKVTLSEHGVVNIRRIDYRKYNALRKDHPDFDQTPCQGCPHNHLASYDGEKPGDPTCFYPPCFNAFKRAQQKTDRRAGQIREMLDEQMLPELLKVASAQPVANALLTPLLAFHAATDSGDYYGALNTLPAKLGRQALLSFFEEPLGDEDNSKIVGTMIEALPMDSRHDLALYLSIDPTGWWRNTEAFAKLFTKAELKELAPNYDPPDVPVDQWRERVVNEVGVPSIVLAAWGQTWSADQREVFDEEDFDTCRMCGCTEFSPCEGGCGWVEDPVDGHAMNGLLLCSNPECVAAAEAEASAQEKAA